MPIADYTWLDERVKAIARGPEFALSAKHAVFTCLLEADSDQYLLKVNKGQVSVIEASGTEPWDFAVRGKVDAWDHYINNDPDPTYRDWLGMVFQGSMSVTGRIPSHFTLEGDERKLFAHLQPLYVLLSGLKKH